MPALVSWLLGGIAASLGSWVGQVLVSLGISYVTFQGIDTLMTWAKTQAMASLSNFAGVSPIASAFVGALQVGTCLNILFSAFVARAAVKGLVNGVVKKMVTK